MKQLSQEQISALPEWMPVEGFPNYEVNCRKGLVRNANTLRVKKPSPNVNGYLNVMLCKDSKSHTKKVHRIVALAAFGYYGISTDGLEVCHLDETRTNSCIGNLVLATHKENLNFPKYKQRNSESRKGKRMSSDVRKKISDAHPKKAVGAYKNCELILTFESIQEAGRNGFSYRHISACCLGKRQHHKGYQWCYLDTTTAMTV